MLSFVSSVVHICLKFDELWNFGRHTEILFDFVLGVLVGILKQSSGETPNESRYKSGGDRYRSRIPAVQEFYCLFLDHCIDLCYHHHHHHGTGDGDEHHQFKV